ncbi:hypothetical protein KA068_00460 [Candidatus Saccharibacteria bacterium]|nr:hypothetical protein [Candidatus Saccharibacteria bacterium]
MRLCFLYHPVSEHRRAVEEYVHEIFRSRGIEIELCSVDERRGADLARVYDVVEYPSLLAIEGNGSLAKFWRGEPLPLMDEVAGYSR